MGSSDLPEPVRRLIADCIVSAADLEILLLLHRTPGTAWDIARVDSELRVGAAVAQAALDRLAAADLLASGEEGFRFEPSSPDRSRAVDQLAEAYATRRVRVIEYLFNKPSDRITLFSDAFRFRRRKD